MDNPNTVPTFTAAIYIGFYDTFANIVLPISIAEKICQEYVDEVGLCVTLTPTKFIYTKGNEPGAIVGLINYPRFPCDISRLRNQAVELAKKLQDAYCQKRVSVVFQQDTIMLSRENSQQI
jgi:hypothetical protein